MSSVVVVSLSKELCSAVLINWENKWQPSYHHTCKTPVWRKICLLLSSPSIGVILYTTAKYALSMHNCVCGAMYCRTQIGSHKVNNYDYANDYRQAKHVYTEARGFHFS